MEPGKVAIDGDRIFAEIQEYTTKDPKDCRFETHRKYYDIQYVAEGKNSSDISLFLNWRRTPVMMRHGIWSFIRSRRIRAGFT